MDTDLIWTNSIPNYSMVIPPATYNRQGIPYFTFFVSPEKWKSKSSIVK